MEWMVYAIVAAVTITVQVEANRNYNCDGMQLNFWRTVIGSLLLAIPALNVPWPTDWIIYGWAALDGLISIFACALLFNMAARKQSRVSSLYSPLATVTGLLLWLAISSHEQQRLLQYPEAGAIILLALVLAAYGLNRFRANDASWSAFIAVLPVGIVFGCADVVSRLILSPYDAASIVIVFAFVNFTVTALLNDGILAYRGQLIRPGKALLQCAAIMAVSSALFFVMLTRSILLAPNPAYPGFFIMTMPVMLLAYHKLRGINDDADWRAALFVVAGALLASAQAVWFSH